MTIKYQPADKRFVLNAINPKFGRGKHYKNNQFSYYRVVDDNIQFGITEIMPKSKTPRPDLAVLNETMINNLKEKYDFCSVSASQSKSTGLDVILRRYRWNECNICGIIFWLDDKEGFRWINEMESYKNKSLCTKCYKKVKKK